MKGEAIACVVLALALSLTGCLDILSDSDDDAEDTASKAVKRYYNSLIREDEEAFCSSSATANGTRYTSSEIEECIEDFRIQEIEDPYGERWMLEYNIVDAEYESFIENVSYSPELVRIANVNVSLLVCFRDSTEDPWECEDWLEMEIYVGKMSDGAWLILDFYANVHTSPFAQFTSTKSSSGDYYVTVVKVSTKYDLEAFSYFLKDSTGTTNEFGEIAMQNLSGNVVGIDVSYGAKCDESCDNDLQTRSNAVDEDDGAIYAVTFNDNDRDGKLSAGDKFTARGSGHSSDGPAQDDWSLEVKFDNTGDVMGSKRLG